MNAKSAAVAVWQAFAMRDRETIHSVLTEDVEWIAPTRNATAVALGVTDHMVGREAISTFILRDYRRLYTNGMRVELMSVTAEDNRVVFEQRQTAVLSNGRTTDNVYVYIFEMEGAQARRIREYVDTHAGYKMVFGDDPPGKIA